MLGYNFANIFPTPDLGAPKHSTCPLPSVVFLRTMCTTPRHVAPSAAREPHSQQAAAGARCQRRRKWVLGRHSSASRQAGRAGLERGSRGRLFAYYVRRVTEWAAGRRKPSQSAAAPKALFLRRITWAGTLARAGATRAICGEATARRKQGAHTSGRREWPANI